MPDPATCPATLRGAVVDRQAQRAWLCEVGAIVRVMPITSAGDQPDPGDLRGLRRGPVDDVVLRAGSRARSTTSWRSRAASTRAPASASTPCPATATARSPSRSRASAAPELFGASSGCIRLRPEDAAAVYDFLAVGHQVHVIS